MSSSVPRIDDCPQGFEKFFRDEYVTWIDVGYFNTSQAIYAKRIPMIRNKTTKNEVQIDVPVYLEIDISQDQSCKEPSLIAHDREGKRYWGFEAQSLINKGQANEATIITNYKSIYLDETYEDLAQDVRRRDALATNGTGDLRELTEFVIDSLLARVITKCGEKWPLPREGHDKISRHVSMGLPRDITQEKYVWLKCLAADRNFESRFIWEAECVARWYAEAGNVQRMGIPFLQEDGRYVSQVNW